MRISIQICIYVYSYEIKFNRNYNLITKINSNRLTGQGLCKGNDIDTLQYKQVRIINGK